MGYRLEISKIKYAACGGKLFGYVEDETKLKSYQWLLEKGYLTGNKDEEFWDYGYNPQIILRPSEFREFIKLYNEDCNNMESDWVVHPKDWVINSKEINELINCKDYEEYILLEWW